MLVTKTTLFARFYGPFRRSGDGNALWGWYVWRYRDYRTRNEKSWKIKFAPGRRDEHRECWNCIQKVKTGLFDQEGVVDLAEYGSCHFSLYWYGPCWSIYVVLSNILWKKSRGWKLYFYMTRAVLICPISTWAVFGLLAAFWQFFLFTLSRDFGTLETHNSFSEQLEKGISSTIARFWL